MSEQLALDLPHRLALGADDFLVSECNAEAVRLVDAWPDWPHPILLLAGPRGAGKTHLANVWRLKSGATRIEAADLAAISIDRLADARAVLVDDIDRGTAPEAALFHFLNLCKEQGLAALLTAVEASPWRRVGLPDLASRLRSLPVARIGPPDDTLLRAVLIKQFADRQIDVAPRVIEFLVARMDRSMEAARDIVAAIDRAALARGQAVTRRLAGLVLAERRPEEEES